jgi:hypothetical protein
MTPTIQGVHWAPPTAFNSQRPGSTHGYGVTDHNALHPELGKRGPSCAWGGASRERGLELGARSRVCQRNTAETWATKIAMTPQATAGASNEGGVHAP